MWLLGVELTRLRWRRAIRVLLSACFLVPAMFLAVTAWNTRPVSHHELQRAQQQVIQARNDPHVRADIANRASKRRTRRGDVVPIRRRRPQRS